MKNAINYYYHLQPFSIHQVGKIYYFMANDKQYVFLPFNNEQEITVIYELANSLIKQGLPIHQIIMNVNNQMLTKMNEDLYVLMNIYVDKTNVSINDIITLNSFYYDSNQSRLHQNDWYTLWTEKVDYFEYQVSQMGHKYALLLDSFSYYVGLAENAISLVNMTSKEQLYLTLGHRRITCMDTYYRLYNPLNLIIDIRVRDACDYFKSCFFNNEDIVSQVEQYIYNSHLSTNEACYFMARMLFPTYYFDMYERIISGEVAEDKITAITSKVDEYEWFLKQIYHYLSQFYQIPEIEWLKKTPYQDV